jgi:hypothetical protein
MFRRELEGVRDEVVHELRDAGVVAGEERHRPGRERERDVFVLCEWPRRLDALGGESGHVDGAHLERELARLDLGEEKEVAHECQQPVGVPLDDAQELTLLVGDVSGFAVEDELEVAADGREGCAQLVRHERDELVLELVELEQPLVLLTLQGEQALQLSLGLLSRSDVARDRRRADDVPGAVTNRGKG